MKDAAPGVISAFSALIADKSVIVCCGSGGTGKTTVSAAIGLAGAEQGRKTCVVTIDPARRLADALGLENLDNTPRRDRWELEWRVVCGHARREGHLR